MIFFLPLEGGSSYSEEKNSQLFQAIHSWKHLFVSFEHNGDLGDDTWLRQMIQLNRIVSFIAHWILSQMGTAKASDI